MKTNVFGWKPEKTQTIEEFLNNKQDDLQREKRIVMKNEMSPEARKLKNEYNKQHRAMSPEAREKYNEYNRQWKRNNPDKVRQYHIDFWERKASIHKP